MSYTTERDAHDERVFEAFKNGRTLDDSRAEYEKEMAEAQKEFKEWLGTRPAPKHEEKEWDGQGCDPEGCHHENLISLMIDQAHRPECTVETNHVLLVAAFEIVEQCDAYEPMRSIIAKKCLELNKCDVDPRLGLCDYYFRATNKHLPNCACFTPPEPVCARKTVDQLTEDEKEFLARTNCVEESEFDRLFNLTKDLKPPYSRSDRALMRAFEKEKQNQ